MSLAKNMYLTTKELAITFKMEKVVVNFITGKKRGYNLLVCSVAQRYTFD